jgi:hypothetical protein
MSVTSIATINVSHPGAVENCTASGSLVDASGDLIFLQMFKREERELMLASACRLRLQVVDKAISTGGLVPSAS